MSSTAAVCSDPSALVSDAPVRRLHVSHPVYSPAGQRILLQAGLTQGMRVADFGCGTGVVTRVLSRLVGPAGIVYGIDVDGARLDRASERCAAAGLTNTCFLQANADSTGLPRNSLDLVYCRFPLLRVSDPDSYLRELKALLRPGGVLVVEEGDLASAASVPASKMDAFADLFAQVDPARRCQELLAIELHDFVQRAGFTETNLELHQPTIIRGGNRYLLQWMARQPGPALVLSGKVPTTELARTLLEMQAEGEDPNILILVPRLSLIWASKPGA